MDYSLLFFRLVFLINLHSVILPANLFLLASLGQPLQQLSKLLGEYSKDIVSYTFTTATLSRHFQ